MNRRAFLQSAAIVTSAAAWCDWPAWAEVKKPTASDFHHWFPQLATPRELWILPAADLQEGMILESAAGLAALGLRQGEWDTLIYEDVQSDGYQRWLKEYCRANSLKVEHLSLDEAVTRLF